MATVQFLPDKTFVQVDPKQTLLDASLNANIPHAHACGGNARCSSCRVIVTEGEEHLPPRNDKEARLAEMLGFKSHIRLACQTIPTSDMTVRRAILDEIDMALIANEFESGEKSLGEEKEVSLLFADIAGYTTLTENSLPYDVVHMLNRYYFAMGNVVQKFDGKIMDYFGDGFLAIFGMDDNRDHAHNAVQAGWQMHREMEALCPYFESFFGHNVHARIGINTGSVILGSIGIKGMQKLAAIGDAVNMAARIEQANKDLGTRFLIAESTYNAVHEHFIFGDRCAIEVKGKAGSHGIFEVQGLKEDV